MEKIKRIESYIDTLNRLKDDVVRDKEVMSDPTMNTNFKCDIGDLLKTLSYALRNEENKLKSCTAN